MTLFNKDTDKKELKAAMSPLAYKILLKPRVTEKSYTANALNKYVFQVTKDADKIRIKKAVEEVYGVVVKSVDIARLPEKRKNFGRIIGMRSGIKKAIVTLEKGNSIELFGAGV